MKRLAFAIPNNLPRLHDALLAAIPALRPVMGASGHLEAVMTVEGDAQHVWLTVPDNTDEATITAVVNAHDPTPDPVPDPPDFGADVPADYSFQLANAVTNLRAYLAASSPTQAATVAALKLTIRVLLWSVKRQVG